MDTTVNISDDQISTLLNCALDPALGFSYYWAKLLRKVEPTSWTYLTSPPEHYREDYPMNPGGALIIAALDDDGDIEEEYGEMTLDRAAIERGLMLMAEKSPEHFADILDENADAITGDVALQYMLLGEIVYG